MQSLCHKEGYKIAQLSEQYIELIGYIYFREGNMHYRLTILFGIMGVTFFGRNGTKSTWLTFSSHNKGEV